jgi:hypothetical protein
MTQALQLLVCVAVAALIAIVSLFVDRWEKSNQGIQRDKRQDSFVFPEEHHSNREETRETVHKGAAMSRVR